jgi:hypothetical protein
MPITVKQKRDGLWLCFDSAKGKHAMVNVDRLVEKKGVIVRSAILETCKECASENQGS